MIKIFHNNRCGKSRSALKILENSGKKFKIINYLNSVPTQEELKKIIALLGIKPIDLVRKNEPIWKETLKNQNFNDEEIIGLIIQYPKLIERPIVINGTKAVIGRPPEKILEII